jgi:hypothetical protein
MREVNFIGEVNQKIFDSAKDAPIFQRAIEVGLVCNELACVNLLAI